MYPSHLVKLPSKYSSDSLGSKGENLQTLIDWGYHVPLTYCLMTSAYHEFIRRNNLREFIDDTLSFGPDSASEKAEIIKSEMMDGEVPEEIIGELSGNGIYGEDDRLWAIRSSSNYEDLLFASFAGLYETFLNVQGKHKIEKAIKKCWASLWNEKAISYRDKYNLNHRDAAMAIVIQSMVDAEYSGVIFTRDPKSINENEMIIEYCSGFGDDLVSGRTIPNFCRINRSSKRIIYSEGEKYKRLEDERVIDICRLASNIEKEFGSPQDIEWTFDGQEFFILQARPISTGHGNNIELKQIWTRANVGEVLPNVITPLTWSIFQATLLDQPERALKYPEEDEGEDKGRSGIDVLKGRVYIQMQTFLDAYCYLPYVTPEIMYNVLGVKIPENTTPYKRPGGIKVRLAQAFFFLNAILLHPFVSRRGQKICAPVIQAEDGVEKAIKWNARCFRVHLKFTGYAIAAYAFLKKILSAEIPGEVDKVMARLMRGTGDYQTATQGRVLGEIAQFVKQNPKLREMVEKNSFWKELREDAETIPEGDQFLRMVETFLDKNGARATGEFELLVPRWREEPFLIIAFIKQLIASDPGKKEFEDSEVRNKSLQETIQRVKKSINNPHRRWLFMRVLESYRAFSTQRENLKYKLMEGYYLLRKMYLRIGEDIQNRSFLKNANDIFFLTSGEIHSLIQGKTAKEIDKLIQERKERHKLWESEDAPEMIIGRHDAMRVGEDRGLNGIGCSAGIAEGIARVILNTTESGSLNPGEILVTKFTDPGWVPLFLVCKGVVTEIGGFLSHGATVAREYGIPCVANVTGVTTLVHSGDLIRVDGERGQIVILQKQTSHSD